MKKLPIENLILILLGCIEDVEFTALHIKSGDHEGIIEINSNNKLDLYHSNKMSSGLVEVRKMWDKMHEAERSIDEEGPQPPDEVSRPKPKEVLSPTTLDNVWRSLYEKAMDGDITAMETYIKLARDESCQTIQNRNF